MCLHPRLLLIQKVKDAAKEAGAEENIEVALSDKDRAHCLDLATCLESTQASTKIDVTMKILREIKARPGNEKTIIFSQFTSMLGLLHFFLQNEDIKFVQCQSHSFHISFPEFLFDQLTGRWTWRDGKIVWSLLEITPMSQ